MQNAEIECFIGKNHKFEIPYKDSTGREWFGFCDFEIRYRYKYDSITYPNGYRTYFQEPVIRTYNIFNVYMVSIDNMDELHEYTVPNDAVKFFYNQFDPKKYEEDFE